jgi:polysaccharide export outer membrane protein
MRAFISKYNVNILVTRRIALLVIMLLHSPTTSYASQLAQGQPGPSASTVEDTASLLGGVATHERNPRYTLSKGDAIDLVFPFTPEFNQSITVQPDGYITLSGVGDLNVVGKTIPELKSLLHAQYSKILHAPAINIVLKDYEKPYFIANGQVARPGKYEMRADLTLTEAIAIAGGFIDSSKHSEVVLYHRLPDNGFQVRTFDVKKMLNSKDLSEDVHLHPGDMFFVPQNRMSKIRKYTPNPALTLPTY